jgi:P27 family predicted phage terminase small subunit
MGRRGPLAIAQRLQAQQQEAVEPEMPSGLSQAAQAEWERLTGLLRERGALDAIDQAALNDYLVCWQRLTEAEADIETRGLLVEGERGPVKNPACQLARQYRAALTAWSKEFGLTPASRLWLPQQPARSGEKHEWDI